MQNVHMPLHKEKLGKYTRNQCIRTSHKNQWVWFCWRGQSFTFTIIFIKLWIPDIILTCMPNEKSQILENKLHPNSKSSPNLLLVLLYLHATILFFFFSTLKLLKRVINITWVRASDKLHKPFLLPHHFYFPHKYLQLMARSPVISWGQKYED